MTILEALAMLEAATLECKKREIDTPEVRDALTLLESGVADSAIPPQPRRRAGTRLRNERRSTTSVTRNFPSYPKRSQRASR